MCLQSRGSQAQESMESESSRISVCKMVREFGYRQDTSRRGDSESSLSLVLRSGNGIGGGGPTEGGEDRDTKGFDVQPFHRLYFSAPFYPFAARALARSPSHASPPYTLLILQRAPKAAID